MGKISGSDLSILKRKKVTGELRVSHHYKPRIIGSAENWETH